MKLKPVLFYMAIVQFVLCHRTLAEEALISTNPSLSNTKVTTEELWSTSYLKQILRPGMSRDQIIILFGKPSFESTENKKREMDYLRPDIPEDGLSRERLAGFVVWLEDDKLVKWAPSWIEGGGYKPKPVVVPSYVEFPSINSTNITELNVQDFLARTKVHEPRRVMTEAEKAAIGAILLKLDAIDRYAGKSNATLSVSSELFQLLLANFSEIRAWDSHGVNFDQQGNVKLRSIANLVDKKYYQGALGAPIKGFDQDKKFPDTKQNE